MRYVKLLATIAFIHLIFAGTAMADGSKQAAEGPKWMQTKTKELVDNARASIQQVSIQELKKLIDEDADITIFDVRTPKEYEVAHISDAINVSRGLLEFSVWSVAPDQDEKIYVYCRTGARAALATKQLNDLGYKNAVSVTTGVVDWAKAGYPLQTSITDEQVVIIPVSNE
jgi:rhodanese-related sulfurtransferase